MYVTDFVYNGINASDFDCMVGSIDGTSDGVITLTSELSINSVNVGNTWKIASTTYEDPYSASFQIIKNGCKTNNYYFTEVEILEIMRWLKAPKQYKKFQAIYDDGSFSDVFFMCVFTEVNPIESAGHVIGFELSFETNAPYGFLDDREYEFSGDELEEMGFVLDEDKMDLAELESSGIHYTFNDYDYEVRTYFPKVVITVDTDGALIIKNSMVTNATVVDNCTAGEVITFSGETKQIYTTSSTHPKIYNDFNYEFPKIVYAEDSSDNEYQIYNAKDINIYYEPVVHVTML